MPRSDRSSFRLLTVTAAAVSLTAVSATSLMAGAHIQSDADLVVPEMTQEQMDGIRAAIKKFEDYDDEKLGLMMARLGNETGYLSDPDVKGDVGILVMAHGYHGEGYEEFKKTFADVAEAYPTAYGFGLGILSSDHLQTSVDALEEAGAERIIILPTESAWHSDMVRQWQYALQSGDTYGYIEPDRVDLGETELYWTEYPMSHPIIAEIMTDHALEMSEDPSNELVILMGHGPSDIDDNDKELKVLKKQAKQVKKMGGFAKVEVANVQDDAPLDLRAENVERIRGWISSAKEKGQDVIVVPTAFTESGLMRKLVKDVEEYDVKFNDTGIMVHPRFKDWLDETIKAAINQS